MRIPEFTSGHAIVSAITRARHKTQKAYLPWNDLTRPSIDVISQGKVRSTKRMDSSGVGFVSRKSERFSGNSESASQGSRTAHTSINPPQNSCSARRALSVLESASSRRRDWQIGSEAVPDRQTSRSRPKIRGILPLHGRTNSYGTQFSILI